VTVNYTFPYGTNGTRLASWTATSTNGFEGVAKAAVVGHSTEPIGANAYLGQLWVSNALAVTPSVSGSNFWADAVPCRTGSQQLVAAVGDRAGNVGYATSTVSVTIYTNGTYGYSAAGCVTSIVYKASDTTNATTLSWDGQYQLAFANTNGATAESYRYDALGRRIGTVSGGVTNWHVYDGPHVAADLDATGGLVRSYVYGPGVDNLLAMTVHTGATVKTYYALTDRLGTVHALADTTGAVVESYKFDAWGRVLGVYNGNGVPLAESAVGNRLLWQGREYSWKTGLYYFRARWYAPVTGRWLSNDPIGISGGLNQYVFCGNNPVNFRDPWGLCEDGWTTTREYVRQLHRDRWWLLTHPFPGTWYAWSQGYGRPGIPRENRDLVSSPYSYEMGPMLLTGPQQGNFNAAFAFTYETGNPLVGAAISVGAEAMEIGRVLSGDVSVRDAIGNAYGSFTANAAGIVFAVHDRILFIRR
jgi:RHS repeat-associated protein